MIARLEHQVRRARRLISRSEWTARLLGMERSEGTDTRPGLVIVQIDGLSHPALRDALASGRMPVAGHLLAEEGYRLHELYSGLPSSTPAAQAELFYGVPGAVPAFGFVDHCSGRQVRMWQHEAAAAVEKRLAVHRSLLAGGGSYCNIYAGGATEARFCMASLGWTDPFRTSHPLALPALIPLYGGAVGRAVLLVARELVMAPGGFVAALADGQHALTELKFTWTRTAVAVLLRELVTLGAMIDLARGLPVVHLNLLSYDEYAHRRGPASALARHALSDIDGVIGRLLRAARRSGRRTYDLWVLSDHGQEETTSYLERYGHHVDEAVSEVFRLHGLLGEAGPAAGAGGGGPGLSQRIVARVVPGLEISSARWEPGLVAVTAQGPLGHVYAPRPLSPDERDVIAADLVRLAHIPLVLAGGAPEGARAWTAAGAWTLPDDAAEILGADHPYLAAAAVDLVRLCHHPDAGDLVISGWQLGAPPLSFPRENGSHAGPGPGETSAFLLAPADAHLVARPGAPLRPADARRAALAFIDQTVRPLPRIRTHSAPTAAGDVIRLLTYNVHSCIGLDGKLSPQRIARVIARYDPDVVALQEVDVGRARTGGVDQAGLIAGLLEMLMHFHPVLSLEEEQYGDAVLSRLPMRVVRAGRLPPLPRQPPLEPRGAVWVEVGQGDRTLQVVNTHLSLHPRERALEVEALLGPGWLGGIEAGAGAVLCGDFNALAWFPVCRRIARTLRDVQVGRFGHRPRNTFWGRFPLGRIDHVFVDPALEVRHVEVPDDALTRVASDHLPVIVDLQRARPGNGGPKTAKM